MAASGKTYYTKSIYKFDNVAWKWTEVKDELLPGWISYTSAMAVDDSLFPAC